MMGITLDSALNFLTLSTTSPNSTYFDDGPSSQFIGQRRLNSVCRIQNRFELKLLIIILDSSCDFHEIMR